MYFKLIVLSLFCTVNSLITPEDNSDSWWPAEFAVIQRVYDDCQNKNDVTGCLKTKALNAVSRAIDQDTIHLSDGLSLVRHNETNMPPAEPRMLDGLQGVDRALLEKLDAFLRTHTISVDLNEGRGRKKKIIPYLLAAILGTAGIAAPIALKTLAVIAGKALIVSKVALTIAGIIALKKLFSHDHHEETSVQVHAGGSGEHNRRNMYLLRPVKATILDNNYQSYPYRYYYDQQMPTTP